jgi:hypothetical protein
MNTPEQIFSETREQFPIGSLVKLSPKGAKFIPKRWHERRGRVVGYDVHAVLQRSILQVAAPRSVLCVVWEGRTRRRICRKHRSDFVLLPAKKRRAKRMRVGGPRRA